MIRQPMGRTAAACLAAFAVLSLACAGQDLRLIAPIDNDSLQFRTDDFVVFFSPVTGDDGLYGLRLSVTNTSGNTIAIDWSRSYFVSSGGDQSDAVTQDVPASFQQAPTPIPIRQTSEQVAIPLCNVSHSDAGWHVGSMACDGGDEFGLHLTLTFAGTDRIESYDFSFRCVEIEPDAPESGTEAVAENPIRWLMGSGILAVGVAIGFLLGRLLATP